MTNGRTNPRGMKNHQGHQFFTRINQARTKIDHAHTEPFFREIVIYFDPKRNSKQFLI